LNNSQLKLAYKNANNFLWRIKKIEIEED